MGYLTKFQWDMAKFPTKQPLKNIADQIAKVRSVGDSSILNFLSHSLYWNKYWAPSHPFISLGYHRLLV